MTVKTNHYVGKLPRSRSLKIKDIKENWVTGIYKKHCLMLKKPSFAPVVDLVEKDHLEYSIKASLHIILDLPFVDARWQWQK